MYMKKFIVTFITICILFNGFAVFADSSTIVKLISSDYKSDDISAVYLFRHVKEYPEFVMIRNEKIIEFMNRFDYLQLYDSIDDSSKGRIELEIQYSLPRKEIYNSSTGFMEKNNKKVMKYLNWQDIEDILSDMNLKWENMNGVDLLYFTHKPVSVKFVEKVSDVIYVEDKNIENMKFMAEKQGDNYGDVFISNLSEEDTKKIYQIIGQLKVSDKSNDDKRLYFSISDNEKVYAYDSRIGFIIDGGDKTVTKKYVDYNEFINALKDNGLDRWREPGGVPERGNMMSTKIETSDEDSTEVFVGQVVENYSIDNIRTIYMSRNVKGYTEQITINKKEQISEFLKHFYDLKMTMVKDNEGSLGIQLWCNSEPSTIKMYNSETGLLNQSREITYYVNLQDIENIIMEMKLAWVANSAGGPGRPSTEADTIEDDDIIKQIIDEYNSVTNERGGYVIKFKVNSPLLVVDDVESQIDEDNKNVVPFIDGESSRTMVPLRAFGNASGCSVEWIEDAGEIVLKNNDKTIEFAIGKSDITVSFEEQSEIINTDSAPVIVENRAFIPLRVVSELFGYDVKWNGIENDILLERKQQ